MILKVGFEHERIITSDGRYIANVRGAKQKLLPHDRFAVLAETRGPPEASAFFAMRSFLEEYHRVSSAYLRSDLILVEGEREVPQSVAVVAYEHDDEEKVASETRFNLVRGGGLHIHFSIHDDAVGGVIPAPKAVDIRAAIIATKVLDSLLGKFISGESNYRKSGEFRSKPWGFEYRSCGWYGRTDDLCELARILEQNSHTMKDILSATYRR